MGGRGLGAWRRYAVSGAGGSGGGVGSYWLAGTAARITIPAEFVLRWDDENHPRDSVMKLFDALGSAEKTLRANPGGHREVPAFEIDSSVRFFARHLGTAGSS